MAGVTESLRHERESMVVVVQLLSKSERYYVLFNSFSVFPVVRTGWTCLTLATLPRLMPHPSDVTPLSEHVRSPCLVDGDGLERERARGEG